MTRTDTMRAVFYRATRRFEPGGAPIPVTGPGEALLRGRRVGICGTDLHIYQGHLDPACRAAASSGTRPSSSRGSA